MVNVDFTVCSMYRADLPRNAVYAPSFRVYAPQALILYRICCIASKDREGAWGNTVKVFKSK